MRPDLGHYGRRLIRLILVNSPLLGHANKITLGIMEAASDVTTDEERRCECCRIRSGVSGAAVNERNAGSGGTDHSRLRRSRSRRLSDDHGQTLPQESLAMLRPQTASLTVLLALLTAFGPISTDMYVPSMPDIGRQLGASTSGVQLTLSSYLAGFAVGQVIYGPIADRFGRKPTLLAALVLFCAASFVCAVAWTIEALVVARAFQALGGAAAVMLPRAVVRDLYTGERAGQELSRMGAIMSVAPVVAPLLGAFVQTEFGWRATFVILAAIGIVTTIVVWRELPETLPSHAARPISLAAMMGRYRAIVSHRAFLANLGIVASSYAGLFAWISGSPFVLQNLYGLTPLWFGVAFATACAGSLAGAAAASSLVMRIGLDRTIGLGTFVLAAGSLAIILSLELGARPVPSLVLSMTVYHVGLMLAMPQAIAAAMIPFANCAGTASSAIGVTQQVSAAVVGAVVGLTVGNSGRPLAIAIAILGCLSLVVWATTRRVRSAVPGAVPAYQHSPAFGISAVQLDAPATSSSAGRSPDTRSGPPGRRVDPRRRG